MGKKDPLPRDGKGHLGKALFVFDGYDLICFHGVGLLWQ